MSRRKAPTLATLADNAAAGRRVVLSAGTLDGPLLLALQRVNFGSQIVNVGDQVSTWAPGIGTHNDESQLPEASDNPSSQMQKEGTR